MLAATWDQTQSVATLTSGNPGAATIALTDDAGNEIDHLVVTVAAPGSIDMVQGWTGVGPTVLAGNAFIFRLGLEADELVVGTGVKSHIGVGRRIGIVGNELVTGVAHLW